MKDETKFRCPKCGRKITIIGTASGTFNTLCACLYEVDYYKEVHINPNEPFTEMEEVVK